MLQLDLLCLGGFGSCQLDDDSDDLTKVAALARHTRSTGPGTKVAQKNASGKELR